MSILSDIQIWQLGEQKELGDYDLGDIRKSKNSGLTEISKGQAYEERTISALRCYWEGCYRWRQKSQRWGQRLVQN